MVRPVLRALDTTPIDAVTADGRGGFAPADLDHFGIVINAYIGPESEPGEDLFRFTVCSPSWLAGETGFRPGLWLRAHLMLHTWDYRAVVDAVEKLCRSIEEPSWKAVALKLSRYLQWEFEDMPHAM